MKKDTMSVYTQEDLRTQWIDKLRMQERDLVRQKAALRDRLRVLLNSGNAVEAGQIQLQLRELDKELQKVNEQTTLGIKGDFLPYEED